MKEELKLHEVFNMAYCYQCKKHVFAGNGGACPYCGALSFYENNEEETFLFSSGWYFEKSKGEKNERK